MDFGDEGTLLVNSDVCETDSASVFSFWSVF